jgi:hypothetical protein
MLHDFHDTTYDIIVFVLGVISYMIYDIIYDICYHILSVHAGQPLAAPDLASWLCCFLVAALILLSLTRLLLILLASVIDIIWGLTLLKRHVQMTSP